MAGGFETSLCAALLSDQYEHPVLVVQAGTVHAANRAAHRLCGFDPTDRPIESLFDRTSAAKLQRSPLTAPRRIELQVECGNALPVAARFMAVPGEDGALLLIGSQPGVGYTEEIGARLMAMQEETTTLLRQLSQSAQHAEAARDSLKRIDELRELFMAALAHDIRSPLNAILLTEAILRKGAHPTTRADLERHASQVERNVRRILDLIDSLLLAMKLDSERPVLTTAPVKLEEIAEEWAQTLQPIAAEGGVTLEVLPRARVQMQGDPVRLGEVFSNLISNAIRFSPPAGRVSVEVCVEDGEILCTVADQGPGVPEALRREIFNKFVQGEESRGVSGLGLYISRRIVELHGGRIWVEDNTPTGARFVFALPLANGQLAT